MLRIYSRNFKKEIEKNAYFVMMIYFAASSYIMLANYFDGDTSLYTACTTIPPLLRFLILLRK